MYTVGKKTFTEILLEKSRVNFLEKLMFCITFFALKKVLLKQAYLEEDTSKVHYLKNVPMYDVTYPAGIVLISNSPTETSVAKNGIL